MKNARIMLSAIALFAILSGAFAFKTHKSVTIFSQQPNGCCNIATQGDVDISQPLINYNTVSSCDCPFQEHFAIGE